MVPPCFGVELDAEALGETLNAITATKPSALAVVAIRRPRLRKNFMKPPFVDCRQSTNAKQYRGARQAVFISKE
jgi:hypothetical protein